MVSNIILTYPGKFGSLNPNLPLALPYLAGVLEKEGHKPKLLDMRVEDYESVSIESVDLVGISCLTGPLLQYALEFAKYVRSKDSDVKIVWGGVHPSCRPEQTAVNEYVDIVVRGEGELTFTEIANSLEKNGKIDDIRGITYKDLDNKIRHNPDREFMNLDILHYDLPYDLLKLDKYPSFRNNNFDIQTSRGCPFHCTYCFNQFFNKSIYRSKKAEFVADEIEYVVDKYHIKHISFIDDEFLIKKSRDEAICREIINRGIDIGWNAICRADTFIRYPDDVCKVFLKSGLKEFSFGVETTSPRLMKMINKDTTPDIILKAAEKAKNLNIKTGYLFMCGFPTETLNDIYMSMDFIDELKVINPSAKFLFAIYTPYPGTDLYDMVVNNKDLHYHPPQTIEEWGQYDFLHFRAPWLDKKYLDFLKHLSTISRFGFWTFPEWYQKFPFNLAHNTFVFMAKKRWESRFFKFPFELMLAERWRDRKAF